MEESKFLDTLKKIYEWSEKFNYFEEHPDIFLTEIKKLDRAFLEEQRETYFGDSYFSKLAPVNFIRLVLLDKVLAEKPFDINIIEELEKKIMEKDTAYFIDYPKQKSYIESFNSKNPFKTWNEFRILFQFYYNYHRDEIIDLLVFFADYLEKKIIKPVVKIDLKRKISSFDGNSNFGRSKVWFAFYPKDKKSHQLAFQYFFAISKKEGIRYSLYPGNKVLGEEIVINKKFSEFNLEEYIEKVKEFNTIFIEKNNNIQLKPIPSKVKPSEEDSEESTDIEDEEVDEEETEEFPLNLIFYGPPGTGKTVLAIKRAVEIIQPESISDNFDSILAKYKDLIKRGRINFITFHQSYSYEEFGRGYRYNKEKKIPEVEPGILKKFIESMEGSSENFVLIIDEINRGNISNVFGEIITIIEPDKRKGKKFETKIELPYSHEKFSLPINLYIIGTMNTADRSIALLDMALRRRFKFEEVLPDSKLIDEYIKLYFTNPSDRKDIIDIFELLNKRIEILIDKDHTIGHSYFMNIKNQIDLYNVLYLQIIPLLKEYFYNDWNSLKKVLGIYQEKDGKASGFIKELKSEYKNVLVDITLEEYPCEIVKYDTRKNEILDILRNTFIEHPK